MDENFAIQKWFEMSRKSKKICAFCSKNLNGIQWTELEHKEFGAKVRGCTTCFESAIDYSYNVGSREYQHLPQEQIVPWYKKICIHRKYVNKRRNLLGDMKIEYQCGRCYKWVKK